MNEELQQLELVRLAPVHYFELECPCRAAAWGAPLEEKHRLPDTSDLCGEAPFAAVWMGWSPEGLLFKADVREPVSEVLFPDPEYGDSVELLIDTRDMKSARFATRFCHRFAFLPEPVEGLSAAETTHFRTEDLHELCDREELSVQVESDSKGYRMQIAIPQRCLVGYNPSEFDRLGFTYRINRRKRPPQHFSATSEDFPIDQCPFLWSRIRLVA